jgi:hypothetical protein
MMLLTATIIIFFSFIVVLVFQLLLLWFEIHLNYLMRHHSASGYLIVPSLLHPPKYIACLSQRLDSVSKPFLEFV